MRRKSCILAFMVSLMGLIAYSRGENFVGYKVNTSCTTDWDVAVNGATIVRHRPTGFGRCLYSGSINRAVTNGWNTVSLLKNDKSSHVSEEEACISFEINYIPNYTGQRDFDKIIPVVAYLGSVSTNFTFKIDGNISRIVGGAIRRPGVSLTTGGVFFNFLLVLYILFVNIFGFIMVVNDRQHAKKRLPRIPASRFVWNAILGGGIGTLLGVVSRKHDMDKTISIVLIPGVILVQLGFLAFLRSDAGHEFLYRVLPNRPMLHSSSLFDRPAGFLHSLKRSDGVTPE